MPVCVCKNEIGISMSAIFSFVYVVRNESKTKQ